MIDQKKVLLALQASAGLAGEGLPVSVCVTDEHGFMLGYTQMDGCRSHLFFMAVAKARTASRMGVSTSQFHARLVREQLSLADFNEESFTSVSGGVPVRDPEGRLLGAVAVSGRRAEEDEALAESLAEMLASPRPA